MNIDPPCSLDKCTQHTGTGWDYLLSIEDETQCTQLRNAAIPVFIASAQQTLLIANEQLVLRIKTSF